MQCQFRFVEEPEPSAVVLRLFVDADGAIKADISGPVFSGCNTSRIDRCVVDRSAAMMAAIRIANAQDVEIVVVGDAGSWDERWGKLINRVYADL